MNDLYREDNRMGLMKCPDCGNDISERAITCIHCGCPIREWIAEQKAAEEAAEATQRTERPVYTPDEVPYPVAEEVPGDPEERAGRAGL